MKILAAMLMPLLFAVGCAGDWKASYNQQEKVWTVEYRDGTTKTFVDSGELEKASKELEEQIKAPPTKAELIVGLGALAKDKGLGAELVVIAEEFGEGRFQESHEDTLRTATWIHDQEERSHRRESWRDVERRSRRAFGELPDHAD